MVLYGPERPYDPSKELAQEYINLVLAEDVLHAHNHYIDQMIRGGCTEPNCYGQKPDCGFRVVKDV